MDRRDFIHAVGLAALGTHALTQDACAADRQRGWRRCKKCEGLFWDLGRCPAGEKHSLDIAMTYVLTANDADAPGQHKWRWCGKCQALWHAGGDAKGKCPAGDEHSEDGSWDYVLPMEGKGQKNWCRCDKCQGLFFAGAAGGVCPAGGPHVKAEKSDFRLDHELPFKRSVTGEEVAGFQVLDAIMLKCLKKIGGTGASLTITRSHQDSPNGKQPTAPAAPIFSRGYGWCDFHQKTPMRPDTGIGIASCDKPFTAAAIRQMALDGKVNLNACIFKVLKIEPKGKIVDNRIWDITINNVLDMKAGWLSGALDKAVAAAGDPARLPSFYDWNAHVLQYVMVQTLDEAPGTKGIYDNFGYDVLQTVIHRRSGVSHPEYLRSHLARPYGVNKLLTIRPPGPPRDDEPLHVWNAYGEGTGDPWVAKATGINYSTPAMCTFMRYFWFAGEPRENGSPTWIKTGSWDNASSIMYWRPDGINFAAAFNGRREIDGDWGKELNDAIDHLVKRKLVPPPPNQPDNLLVNGSFEEGHAEKDAMLLEAGSTAIKGWKVTHGQVHWRTARSGAQDGERCIELRGEPGHSGIEQAFKTSIGIRYRVTFAMAGDPNGTTPIKRLIVRAGGKQQQFAFDTTGRKNDDMGWVEYAWEFEAVAERTALKFHTVIEPDPPRGPALDNVRVWIVAERK